MLESRILIHDSGEIYYYMEFEKISNLYYPHFVAEYEDHSVKVALDLTMIEGELPDGKIYEVIQWAKTNNSILQGMWGKLIKMKKNQINMRRAV
jgi:hypothetical protein